MDFNSQAFKEFLRNFGVEWGGDTRASQFVHEEPDITLLQQSRYHEAFYRVDLLGTRPQLLVLLPTHDAPLKFYFYMVHLSEFHPLFDVLERFDAHSGSDEFEQERGFAEWQLLHAVVETMKVLFWVGMERSQFPHEITVQKVL